MTKRERVQLDEEQEIMNEEFGRQPGKKTRIVDMGKYVQITKGTATYRGPLLEAPPIIIY